MNILRRLLEALVKDLPKRTIHRDGPESGAYLERYYLCGDDDVFDDHFPADQKPRIRWWQKYLRWLPTTYVHRFLSGDDEEWLHSHPWEARSLVLAGGYVEERRGYRSRFSKASPLVRFFGDYEVRTKTVLPGSINRIGRSDFHRIRLVEKDCWTLFVVGRRIASWGWWHPRTGAFLENSEFKKMKEIQSRLNARGGVA